jgi:hypothetical protein
VPLVVSRCHERACATHSSEEATCWAPSSPSCNTDTSGRCNNEESQHDAHLHLICGLCCALKCV